jgi:hypothetical protein
MTGDTASAPPILPAQSAHRANRDRRAAYLLEHVRPSRRCPSEHREHVAHEVDPAALPDRSEEHHVPVFQGSPRLFRSILVSVMLTAPLVAILQR